MRPRELGAFLLLACAAPLAAGSPLLASALALGLHASEHAHAFSVVVDDGHVDLVVSHAEDHGAHPHALAGVDFTAPVSGDADHVVHVSADSSGRPHRVISSHALPGGSTFAPVAPAPPSMLRGCSAPSHRLFARRSAVVLRL